MGECVSGRRQTHLTGRDAASDCSVDEQFAGLQRHLGPKGLARPQHLLPFSLFFPSPTPL
jgi:hypothetical protein